ncbi:aromatic ring-hydroxylating oxygenase subunit alpha [Novosphingobium sp.]|uniref:aromatic ring-hydroxylating oxygenase subunit alpha n=1 Tax=Novosphingobium sp. TaxID=1874826 RepID=UPI0038B89384
MPDSQENTVSRRYGIPLSALSTSQIDAIRRIPRHQDARPPSLLERRSVEIFLSDEYWKLEKARIFRAKPVVVAPSALLPEPGMVVAQDGYGIPLLITRDKAGKIHLFLNACTHKGAALVDDCAARKWSTISCPYHAWAFGLDGRLIGVPRAESYANFDKTTRPLTRLPSQESGGLIWGILDPHAEADFSIVDDQIAVDFQHLGLPNWHLYGQRRFNLDANWKLVMEPFLEGYHVQRLHVNSIGPQGMDMFADVVGVADRFGLHTRQTSGRGNYKPEVLDDPQINIRNFVTHAYNLFPNTVVITSPYYTSVMIIMPVDAAHTRVDYYMLTETAPDNPKAEELYARSFTIIQDVFGNEDFKASELCHRGLASGAVPDVIYCGMEAAIPQFYEGIEGVLRAESQS